MAIRLLNQEPELMSKKKKMSKEEVKKDIARCRARDNELITGIFTNLERPGNYHKFGLKLYPGDDFVFYHLVHGEKHRIPRGVARHLNMNCHYVEYINLKDEFGKATSQKAAINDGRLNSNATMSAKRKVPRFSFTSLEYMDIDDDWDSKASNLIEVEVNPIVPAIHRPAVQ
jgi:hypothetical protein